MAGITPPAGFALLPDKIVVVTGASRGIGRAIALTAAAHGSHIVVHHLDHSTLNEATSLKQEIETLGRQAVLVDGDIADVATSRKIVDVAVQAFGRVDALFSNAGICPFHDFLTMPDDLWKTVQGVNLDGSFYITREVAQQMTKQTPQGGAIVAISSISALVGGAQQTHYTPTKAGIKSLMESCAVALGKFNIRCNSVLPGTIRTAINEEDLADTAKRSYMESRIPLQRLGAPDDIAGPAVFLASDMAKYISVIHTSYAAVRGGVLIGGTFPAHDEGCGVIGQGGLISPPYFHWKRFQRDFKATQTYASLCLLNSLPSEHPDFSCRPLMTSGFRNPILPGLNPDPTIIRDGTDYFLVTSSFEYFPGLPIYTSKNLIEWTLLGHVLSRTSQLFLRSCEPSGGIFAPSLTRIRGKFYVAVCAMHRKSMNAGKHNFLIPPRGFYISTDNIRDCSSWSDPTYFDALGIDQDLFHDPLTDKIFLSFATIDRAGHSGPGFPPIAVHVCEIDLDTGRQLTPARKIKSAPSHLTHKVSEGPHIFVRNGYYYLSTAEGGTEAEHQQCIARSRDGPLGPWEIAPYGQVNPILYNGDDAELQLTGHSDFVEAEDGSWWAVFLAVRPVFEGGKQQMSPLGRETCLAPVKWIDDWPVVNGGQRISFNTTTQTPNMPRLPQYFDYKLPFNRLTDIYLDGWYHLRTPLKQEHDLAMREGSLALWGGPYSLHQAECPTMLLQKQPDRVCSFSVVVDFQPVLDGSEAGVTAFFSQFAFASLSIRRRDSGQRELVFRHPDLNTDEDVFLEHVVPCTDSGSYTMEIRTEPNKYTFLAASGGDNTPQAIGSITSAALARTRPFDSTNCGTHLGIYANGANDNGALVPAFFSNVAFSGQRSGGA